MRHLILAVFIGFACLSAGFQAGRLSALQQANVAATELTLTSARLNESLVIDGVHLEADDTFTVISGPRGFITLRRWSQGENYIRRTDFWVHPSKVSFGLRPGTEMTTKPSR